MGFGLFIIKMAADVLHNRFKGIIFDLDGTLLDTIEDIADSMNFVLKSLGFPTHPVDKYKLFVGDGIEKLVVRALPLEKRSREIIQSCIDALREEYKKNFANKTKPYSNVPELLDHLEKREIPKAILSNKPHHFTKKVVNSILSKWNFYPVMGALPDLPKKPSPEPALRVANEMQLIPSEIIYVGDTNVDMQTALSSGMYPIGAAWGFRTKDELLKSGARVVIKNPLELLDII